MTKATRKEIWHKLIEAGKMALKDNGYDIFGRRPGRGRLNVWKIRKDGKEEIAVLRTSQDRCFAFAPQHESESDPEDYKWKTLDEANAVIVSTVDNIKNPQEVQIYMLPAAEVRKHLDESYKARIEKGYKVDFNMSMWIYLDKYDTKAATGVGSGIIANHEPIATYPLSQIETADASVQDTAPAKTPASGDSLVVAAAVNELKALKELFPEASLTELVKAYKEIRDIES